MNDPILDRTFPELMDEFTWEDRWSYFDGNRESFNTAHECVHRWAERTPDNVALRIFSDSDTVTSTFEEVSSAVSGIAAGFREHGIGDGSVVGLYMSPTLEYVASLFAVMQVGGVVVPASKVLDEGGLASRMRHAKADLLVVDRSREAGQLRDWCTVIERPRLREWVKAQGSPVRTTASTSQSSTAMYIYSSGTTGAPKRTALSHGGLPIYTSVVGKMVAGLRPGDKYLATYSSGWLGGVAWALLVPMSIGTAGGLFDGRVTGEALCRVINRAELTALHAPPTAYRRILSSDVALTHRPQRLAYTAEPLYASEAEAIYRGIGSYARGQYGASEVGFVAIDYALDGYEVRPGSLGKPLPGVEVKIIDDGDGEVSPGTVGHIALVRKDELLRTGDKGSIDEEGYLWFEGRADQMIISAGYTISPSEIENAIVESGVAEDAAVLGRPDQERGQRVVALVIPTQSGHRQELEDQVQKVVREKVGAHAYPREVHVVDTLPRTEGGKVKRSALAEMAADLSQVSDDKEG